MEHQQDINDFMSEVDSGAFKQQINAFMNEVAKSIFRFDKGGKVEMTFDIKPSKKSAQNGAGIKVMVTAKATYKRPTPTGAISEDTTTETPMWVNKDGSISLLAKSHDDLFGASAEKVSSLNLNQ